MKTRHPYYFILGVQNPVTASDIFLLFSDLLWHLLWFGLIQWIV